MTEKSGQPAYMKIFMEIADDIACGNYRVGDAIPTQLELAEKYEVSRVTVREAIKELARRGVVLTQKGKGTSVIGKLYDVNAYQRTESMRVEGFSKSGSFFQEERRISRLFENELVSANDKVANHLKVPVGTLVRKISRVRYLNDITRAVETSYLLNSMVSKVDFETADMENGSLYQLLKSQAGIVFGNTNEEFKAVACPREISERLGITPNEPILFIRRVSGGHKSGPVEYVEIYSRSDLFYTVVHSRREEEPVTNIKQKLYDKVWGCLLGIALGYRAGLAEQAEGFSVISEGKKLSDYTDMAVCLVCNVGEFFLQDNSGKWSLKNKDTPNHKPYAADIEEYLLFLLRVLLVGAEQKNDIETSIKEICLESQYDRAYLLGGFAIAQAARAAVAGASVVELVQAAVLGTQKEEKKEEAGCSPSISGRIHFASTVAKESADMEHASSTMKAVIGNRSHMEEVIPLAFGVVAATNAEMEQVLAMSMAISGTNLKMAATAAAISGLMQGGEKLVSSQGLNLPLENRLIELAHNITEYLIG